MTSIRNTLPLLVLMSACAAPVGPADSDELVLVGLDDTKADSWFVLDPGEPRVGVAVLCAAETGCSFDLAMLMRSVGVEPAAVRVKTGRFLQHLVDVDTIAVGTGPGDPVSLPINIPPQAEGDRGEASGYDSSTHALLVFELEDPHRSAVSLEVDACIHDLSEATGEDAPLLSNGSVFGFSGDRTIHSADDVDVYGFDVVDELSFDTSARFGHILEVSVFGTRSSHLQVTATYTCTSDGTALAFEPAEGLYGEVLLVLDPDCPTIDDSGHVRVEVRDPSATPFTCPAYFVTAKAQASYL